MERLTIQKNSPVPIYYQISQYFRGLISQGKLSPGDSLPSENELARNLGVGKMTVRQAMADLVNAGLVYRERGKGTFVAFPKHPHSLRRLTSFTEDITSRGMAPGQRILKFEYVAADKEVASRLRVSPGSQVLYLERLRLADDIPVGIHKAHLAGVPITKEELEREGSLYALIEEKGLKITEAEESLEAVAASPEEARLLRVAEGSPLLLVVRVACGPNAPIEFVKAVYRSDFYRYTLKLRR